MFFCRAWLTPLHAIANVKYAKNFLRHVSRKNTATQTRRNISQHYDLVSTHISSLAITFHQD
jgi:cyclopropane-fatty-acyl-phospholipid synthase